MKESNKDSFIIFMEFNLEKVMLERLKEISAGIIGHYRAKNYSALLSFPPAKQNGGNSKNIGALFAQLIQSYHPDKFSHIQKSIADAYAEKNLDLLLTLKDTYLFDQKALVTEDLSYFTDSRESYGYDKDDFGYQEKSVRDDDDLEDDDFDRDNDAFIDDTDFIAAVNRTFFGGLNMVLNAHDLNNLEGDLDLGDFEIYNLNGVEHCTNIRGLDLSSNHIERIGHLSGLYALEKLFLSENRIEDISALRNLDNLVEVDLSFNMIDSIDDLVHLKKLQHVNVMGNPVKNMEAISQLIARGVIVLHDMTFVTVKAGKTGRK